MNINTKRDMVIPPIFPIVRSMRTNKIQLQKMQLQKMQQQKLQQQKLQQQNLQQQKLQQQKLQQQKLQQQKLQNQKLQQQKLQQQKLQQQKLQQQKLQQQKLQQQNLQKSKRIIPLNIFQTYHTMNVPIYMKNNIFKLRRENPEFKYYLFDDAMCRKFIKNHFDNNVVNAFDALKPGAYKADLWRYCILYIYGGIYMDIKFGCEQNFKLINLLDKEYYVRDRCASGRTGIYQAFLVSLPKNPILFKCINQIVENVKSKFYGDNPLCVTGPHLISNYFEKDEIDKMELYHGDEGDCVYLHKRKIINIYKHYRKEQRATAKTAYYHKMWRDKSIYV